MQGKQQHLHDKQYADSGNLHARASLHERFSTNKTGWHTWVFDQFEFPADAAILECGSGSGMLWQQNAARIPSGWQITLSDFSAGMLADARTALATSGQAFAFEQCDVAALPFDDARFDAVIANHMLYHVTDIPAVLREIRRVLRPGGLLYAATNGEKHMRELHDLARHVLTDDYERLQQLFKRHAFTLDSGAQVIEQVFPRVEKRLYEDALVVTEAEPLIAYVQSMAPASLATGAHLAALRALMAQDMSATGAVLITKDSGLFIARKP